MRRAHSGTGGAIGGAGTTPSLSTTSGRNRSRSGRTSRSARRPGAIAPRSPSPCQVAALQEAIASASRASTPASTARRTIELTWPSRAMCPGSRSSVQNAIRPGPNSCTSGSSASRFRAPDASRISSHMPARSRSRPSCGVVASWSDPIPAAAYACSRRPSTPGAWPSTCSAPSRPSFASSSGSPAITPGKFIISARPSTLRRRSRPSRSPVVSARRGDSNRDAGTHDGAMKNTSSGRSAQASASQCTPSVPSTFAISWGSATTDVVPNGSTSLANSSTSSIDDSRCRCASIRPGTTYRPPASSVSRPRYSPTPAIQPSHTATSASSHSRVYTDSTRPPCTTRSAGSSPRATASRRVRSVMAAKSTRFLF